MLSREKKKVGSRAEDLTPVSSGFLGSISGLCQPSPTPILCMGPEFFTCKLSWLLEETLVLPLLKKTLFLPHPAPGLPHWPHQLPTWPSQNEGVSCGHHGD